MLGINQTMARSEYATVIAPIKRLRLSIIAQLLVITLPLLAIIGVQNYSLHAFTEHVKTENAKRDLAIQVDREYGAFESGVVDAVDTGSLSRRALDALERSEKALVYSAKLDEDSAVQSLAAAVKSQLSELRNDNKLNVLQSLRPSINVTSKDIDAFLEHTDGAYQKDFESLSGAAEKQQIIALVLVVLSICVTTFLVRGMITHITVPVEKAVVFAVDIAAGDFSNFKDATAGGYDLGGLLAQFSKMSKRWTDVIMGLRGQCGLVSSLSAELRSNSSILANNNFELGAASSAIAVSIEQLSNNIIALAHFAETTNAEVKSVGAMASSGSQVIAETAKQIELVANNAASAAREVAGFEQKASQAQGIVQIIRSIAEQTNLLALNAAIEAARAGSAGRGFAVVADEVRNLAVRTSEATVGITSVINEIIAATMSVSASINAGAGQADLSVSHVTRVSTEVQQINAASERAIELVERIYAGLNEQQQASANIVSSIASITTTTNQNAEQAKKISQTSERLKGVSVALAEDIAYFNIEGGSSGSVDLF